MIAFAGTPGSGKSTISAELLACLRQQYIEDVAVVPMDGFHYNKERLRRFSDPTEAALRRGAPFTYDAEAFVKTVEDLHRSPVTSTHDPTLDFRLPGFDHSIQDPVDGQVVIKSNAKVIILEGNYVLFDQDPWRSVAAKAHERWFVDVPRNEAIQRLVKRHVMAGIDRTAEAAQQRVKGNDLLNSDLIRLYLIQPDVTLWA